MADIGKFLSELGKNLVSFITALASKSLFGLAFLARWLLIAFDRTRQETNKNGLGSGLKELLDNLIASFCLCLWLAGYAIPGTLVYIIWSFFYFRPNKPGAKDWWDKIIGDLDQYGVLAVALLAFSGQAALLIHSFGELFNFGALVGQPITAGGGDIGASASAIGDNFVAFIGDLLAKSAFGTVFFVRWILIAFDRTKQSFAGGNFGGGIAELIDNLISSAAMTALLAGNLLGIPGYIVWSLIYFAPAKPSAKEWWDKIIGDIDQYGLLAVALIAYAGAAGQLLPSFAKLLGPLGVFLGLGR